MAVTSSRRGAAVLAAATVINLPFGTLYAFSVFLQPMEALLGVGRAQMSIVFALATVTLTVAMNIAPLLYRVVHPAPLAMASALCSAAGLGLTATADGFAQLVVGYGILFGLGAGIAFTAMQQCVNSVSFAASGVVNGYVVSLYPLGAMIGAPAIGWSIGAFGMRATLWFLAVVVIAGGAVATALLRAAAIDVRGPVSAERADGDPQWRLFLLLSAMFFFAAAAGLMVLSQAAGIVQAYGGRTALALGATTFITGAIAAARIGGGWLVDRFPVPRVAMFANAWSLAGALALTAWPSPLMAVPALAMIGMGYGFVSGLTAGAIARYWGSAAFGRVAARLYIAWCVAAVSLPVIAGWLYDRTQGYGAAVAIAAAFSFAGLVIASRLPAGRP